MQKQLQTISRSDINKTPLEALKLILAFSGEKLSPATLADINTMINFKQKVA